MFWIYIPPIILVIALAALAVILGRKSAALKKIRINEPESNSFLKKTTWKNRFNFIGRKTLDILEKTLDFSKVVFKKTEQLISHWTAKLRAKRKGEKFKEAISDYTEKTDEAKIIEEIEKTEEISANLAKTNENKRHAGDEIIVRKKIADEPIAVPKKEPLPEDKVREAALIYRIAENPKDLEAYREIGDYYIDIGNIKDAKEAFKMVLKLRPRDLKAKSSLREIEMRMRLGN